MQLFCFGYGYVAQFLSYTLLERGWTIGGTSSIKKTDNSITIYRYDRVNKDFLRASTHILISVPPEGDDILERYGDEMRNIKWLGYLSATNVYGDHAGHWVTEESETRPIEVRGKSRIHAEIKWMHSILPIHIFRLSGIYGPQRNVLVDLQHHKARNIQKTGHLFSRIHVFDIINIILSSMQRVRPGEIYNCADDLPATQSEVLMYGAQLLNMALPQPTEISTLSEHGQSFFLGSKKVSNLKIKQDLKISLMFANYKIGLKELYRKL
ncbi:SDR family oxidoreductase [Wolbachia endosymbiont of Howardula sp.]|uniref:SDR family oxidoreductase n=1 Tax=Wolbachia endosymbiont of Howardula sp. TaxID=2916816 RepID=UPI00217E96FC|nr:SDR family oxidoreductase [Wolbachia endosymbiont of Howardula sp.]UWI83285.1 SDR family oxidoreductase [Wolbachia endosymbiont of Howardula sp.]